MPSRCGEKADLRCSELIPFIMHHILWASNPLCGGKLIGWALVGAFDEKAERRSGFCKSQGNSQLPQSRKGMKAFYTQGENLGILWKGPVGGEQLRRRLP